MNLTENMVLYDILGEKVVVTKVRNDGFFDAVRYSIIRTHYNADKNIQSRENKEYCELKISSIGCTLFYGKEDKNKGKGISNLKEYKWNKDNIDEFYNSKEQEELSIILKNAPTSVILNEEDRKNLIKGYLDIDYSADEERKFFEKYSGKYFARMDFDIEFFKRNKEYLWKNHYYDKIYVGKQGTVYDDNNKVIIADWRSPIGGFVNDNKNRAYNIGEKLNPLYCYNYELLLKRRFSSNGDFNNVWVADSGFYNDGDMDTFLLDVLTRLRREGNDKATDIIETIQKEQNDIVRFDNRSFYVQGCAGSGKTMVLLHRLSYLSYNDKNFDFSRVKIITPNENIIVQLKELSAQLEISNIEQLTIEQYYIETIKEYSQSLYNTLTNKYSNSFGRELKKYTIQSENSLNEEFLQYVYGDEFKEVIDKRYKAYFDDLFKPVLDIFNVPNSYDLKSIRNLTKEIYSYLGKSEENKSKIERLKNDVNKLNDSIKDYEKEINGLAKENEGSNKAKELKQQDKIRHIEKKIEKARNQKADIESQLKELGWLPDDESKIFKRMCNKLLVKENDTYTSELKLTGSSIIEEILMPEMNNLYLKYDIPENRDVFKHILYLILYLLIKLRGEKSLSNLICIDEAQDLTLNEYRIIKSVNKKAKFNLFGDTNQLLYKGRGIETWASLSSAGYELQPFKLNRNYRNVANITRYCNSNLAGLNMVEMGVVGESVKEIGLNSFSDYINEINVVIVKNKDILKYIDTFCKDYNFIENKNQLIDKTKLNVITVEMSKGMEFSKVIVVDKDMTSREKYVAYTRALNNLVVCK